MVELCRIIARNRMQRKTINEGVEGLARPAPMSVARFLRKCLRGSAEAVAESRMEFWKSSGPLTRWLQV